MHAFIDRLSRPRLVLAGALLGFTWGVLIRLWMRLISTDPEFTWGGTIYILMAATVFGMGVAGAAAGRRSPRRWARRVTRVLGGVSLIFLAGAAGSIMVASVIPMTLAVAERRWWRPARLALFALALLPMKVVYDEIVKDSSALETSIAMVVYLALGTMLVAGWASIVGSRRPSRRARREAERAADRVGSVGDRGLEFVG